MGQGHTGGPDLIKYSWANIKEEEGYHLFYTFPKAFNLCSWIPLFSTFTISMSCPTLIAA